MDDTQIWASYRRAARKPRRHARHSDARSVGDAVAVSWLDGAPGGRPSPSRRRTGAAHVRAVALGVPFNAVTLRWRARTRGHRRRSPPRYGRWSKAAAATRHGAADPLMDVLVHGQDIALPLGIDPENAHRAGGCRRRTAVKMGFPFYARRRFSNVRFIADRRRFQRQGGEEVRGPIQDIVMTLSGRRAGLPVE